MPYKIRQDEILEHRTFGARIYGLRISRPDGRAYFLAALRASGHHEGVKPVIEPPVVTRAEMSKLECRG